VTKAVPRANVPLSARSSGKSKGAGKIKEGRIAARGPYGRPQRYSGSFPTPITHAAHGRQIQPWERTALGGQAGDLWSLWLLLPDARRKDAAVRAYGCTAMPRLARSDGWRPDLDLPFGSGLSASFSARVQVPWLLFPIKHPLWIVGGLSIRIVDSHSTTLTLTMP
jgi:hypothetical protein